MPPTRLNASARREQILDAAQDLFLAKGYETATIEDVLTAVGIAKGTLYHHFRSKEAILEAIVARTCEEVSQRSAQAAEATAAAQLPAPQRLLAVLAAARADDEDIALSQQLQAAGNMRFHLMSLTHAYRHLHPLLTQVVADGVATGELHSTDPAGDVEIILAAGMTLLEGGIFSPADLTEAAESDADSRAQSGEGADAPGGGANAPASAAASHTSIRTANGTGISTGASCTPGAIAARRRTALIRAAAALLGADLTWPPSPAAAAAPSDPASPAPPPGSPQ
ncbi:HTH-type transcriptional repressor KstR2 [Actinomyces bovis]|uniref:HTH-type transcriptional repressor KstR2 n=1 Tax=Actinomyces bovis TaxID=1658 RepID=A0ABY1VN36_9ACTO|nr:TetR/AcrR family transcriptional regulator [Actinomyces bovis]SPT53523.1 HTH-type transcriptional repressor KstR2 [Actinomyces bovis]VEG55467.1 HTH-type transcriptional repressor KstR2 [Actinomyces israelii]